MRKTVLAAAALATVLSGGSAASAATVEVPKAGIGVLLPISHFAIWNTLGLAWSAGGAPVGDSANPGRLDISSVEWDSALCIGSICDLTKVHFTGSFQIDSSDEGSVHLVLDDLLLDVASGTLSASVDGLSGGTQRLDIFIARSVSGSTTIGPAQDSPAGPREAAFRMQDMQVALSFMEQVGDQIGEVPEIVPYVRGLKMANLDVTVKAVPEPSAWWLTGLGLAAVAVRRARAAGPGQRLA